MVEKSMIIFMMKPSSVDMQPLESVSNRLTAVLYGFNLFKLYSQSESSCQNNVEILVFNF